MSSRIIGIGTDIVEIARIRLAMRSPRFLSRILTPAELRPQMTPEWFAGRWAAKEAVAKALGTHLKWHDVQILSDSNGKPYVKIKNGIASDSLLVHISISHEREYATAMVVVENGQPESDTI